MATAPKQTAAQKRAAAARRTGPTDTQPAPPDPESDAPVVAEAQPATGLDLARDTAPLASERGGARRQPPPASSDSPQAAPPEQIDTSNQPAPPKRHRPVLGEGQRYAVPITLKDRQGVRLLLDACEIFALNPDPEIFPCEVLSWHYYQATPRERRPSVRLTTGGGRKLRVWKDPLEPWDVETEDTLRTIFGAWRTGKDKVRIPLPLPDDLTLPYEAAVGFPASMEHQFTGGYLRRDPATAADADADDRTVAPA